MGEASILTGLRTLVVPLGVRTPGIGCSMHIQILNPILHGGEGGQKVVALISIVENFGEIQTIVMKLGDFSQNLLQITFLAKKLIR